MSHAAEQARLQTARALELVRELERATPTNCEGYSCVTLALGQLEHATFWLASRHLTGAAAVKNN